MNKKELEKVIKRQRENAKKEQVQMANKSSLILKQVERVIVGKNDIVSRVLMAILSGGHILMEDVPGTGKTTLALAFAKSLGIDFKRIQFTSDSMPSDVIGFSVYDKSGNALSYKPGAAMTNLLLADEINRTSSKTQSALLEVMEEGQITVDGVTVIKEFKRDKNAAPTIEIKL